MPRRSAHPHLRTRASWSRPYAYGLKQEIEPEALRRIFTHDTENAHPARAFSSRASRTSCGGCLRGDLHLFGPKDPEQIVHLLGADRLGRDLLSRMIYGTRISLSIGLVGVAISFFLGMLLGGISGYYGGAVDDRHPARDRVPALRAHHPALDGPGRGGAARTGRRCASISASRSSSR